MVVIFDIDGTLADCSHRVQYAQSKEWDEFHSRCLEDNVIVNVADLMIELSQSCEIILLTGRPEKYRHMTEQWLELCGLDDFYDELIMRPDNDWSQDAKMKVKALEDHFGDQQAVLDSVWLVIDDRDSVVEALRNYGLTVLQPAVSGY
jgi:FMN phosphatase YigB (HAD superfamily)